MKRLLLVVDMQNDFIDGALGTPEAQQILDNVNKKIKSYDQAGDQVIFTVDTHADNYLESQEGKRLPVCHCIKDSEGWNLNQSLYIPPSASIIEKHSFGSKDLGLMLMELDGQNKAPLEIELIGLCTDICIIANALIAKTFLPECRIIVDSNCCAGVTPEGHSNALAAMKICQIDII